MGFKARVAESCNRRNVKGVTGPFIEFLLPALIQMLQSCLQPKPTPTPQPATSKATAESWKTADEAQAFAMSKIKSGQPTDEIVEYKRTASNKAKRAIQKQAKSNGEHMTGDEAERYAHAHLDALRLGSLEENALLVDANK